MKCKKCGNEMKARYVTKPVPGQGTTVVSKRVDDSLCKNCTTPKKKKGDEKKEK